MGGFYENMLLVGRPTELTPELIDELVTINVYEKNEDGSIKPDSKMSFVGRLENYADLGDGQLIFQIHGAGQLPANNENWVEFTVWEYQPINNEPKTDGSDL